MSKQNSYHPRISGRVLPGAAKQHPAGGFRTLYRVHPADHPQRDFYRRTPQVTPQVEQLLGILTGEMSRGELQEALGLQDRKSFRDRYLGPALAEGLIEMTLPGKPNSRLQKYRLTGKGRNWLRGHKESSCP
jgi:hypothetical protein